MALDANIIVLFSNILIHRQHLHWTHSETCIFYWIVYSINMFSETCILYTNTQQLQPGGFIRCLIRMLLSELKKTSHIVFLVRKDLMGVSISSVWLALIK